MTRINWSRVILAGLAAGVLMVLGAVLVDGTLLHHRWSAQMESMGKAAEPSGGGIALFVLSAVVSGILTAWLYAIARTQYLPGPRTAVIVGVIVWLLSCVVPSLFLLGSNLFGPRLLAASAAGELVSTVAAALVAGWLYRPAGEVVAVTPGVSA